MTGVAEMRGRYGKTFLIFAFAVGIAPLLTSVAHASLIGDRFDCHNSFNFLQPGNVCETTFSGSSDVLIGAGIEITTDNFQVDIDAASITMTNVGQSDQGFNPVTPNTIEFTSLDWVDDPSAVISGFSLETDVSGFNAGDVTIFDHGVTVFVNETWQSGGFIRVNLETSRALPAPSTLALFAVGLAGISVTSRRRRQDAVK